jgi:hypothetical protein
MRDRERGPRYHNCYAFVKIERAKPPRLSYQNRPVGKRISRKSMRRCGEMLLEMDMATGGA